MFDCFCKIPGYSPIGLTNSGNPVYELRKILVSYPGGEGYCMERVLTGMPYGETHRKGEVFFARRSKYSGQLFELVESQSLFVFS